MKDVLKTINIIIKNNFFKSAVAILISLILYKIISNILLDKTKKIKLMEGNKSQTIITLVNNIIKYLFIIITFIVVLRIHNINVTSMIAGLGLAGAGIVLAVQDALKDIVRGASIISDNYFKVGDIVKYGDIEGKVLVLGLKTTKIKDIATGNTVSISNRNIEQIAVVSNYVYINIPLSYELKLKKAEEVVNEITTRIKKLDNIKECNYLGVNNFNDSSIDYLISLEVNNIDNKRQSRRDALNVILSTLEDNKIEIPYNQLDIHNKD